MRANLRGAPVALLLLGLLLVPAPGAAQGTVAPELAALRSATGELRVVITAESAFSGDVVVTHEDALLGTVVDRVAPVVLDARTRTTLELPGLRADVPFLVRLVTAGNGPDLMRYVELYDGASATGLFAAATTTVPAGSEAGRSLPLPTHDARLLRHDGSVADFRVLVTTQGVVVVGYEHRPTGALALRASRDGGHTWGREHVLMAQAEREYAWAMAEIATGKVRVFAHDQRLTPEVLAEPWSVYDLDTLADRVTTLASVANTITFGHANIQPDLMVVLDDGTALLPEHVTGTGDANVTMWTLAPGGTTQVLAVIPTAEPVAGRILATDGERVALVYTTSSPAGRVYIARSDDSGATWSAPTEVTAISRHATGYGLSLRSARMGAAGVVHALVDDYDDERQHLYARVAANGASTARVLDGDPTLAVEGRRVGVTHWSGGEQRYLESVDGGVTFAQGPTFATRLGHTLTGAFLPDGRPLLVGRSLNGATQFGVGLALPFDPAADPRLTVVSTEPLAQVAPTPVVAGAPSITRLYVPLSGSDEPVLIDLANDASASIESTLSLSVNGRVVTTYGLTLAPGTETLRVSIAGLGRGDEVVAELQPGGSTARATVDGPLVVRATPGWEHATAPSSYDANGSQDGSFAPATPPAASAPSPSNDSSVAVQGPPVNSEKFSFSADPTEVRLARGGSARVMVTFSNDDPNFDMGSEPPSLLDAPVGVSWSIQEREWRLVRPGERVGYEVSLYASPDAPDSTEVVTVQGRRALDRPAFTTQFTLIVEEPAKNSSMPPIGFLVAGALAGLAGLGVAFRDWWRHLWALALAPMYTRISKAQVLGNDVRKGIYDHVVAHPGERLASIAKALDLTVTPTLFHLRVLEREGYVASRREWSRALYYPTERAPAFSREPRDVASTLTRLLAENPGLPPADVAQRLGISRQLARYHLLALEKQGVLRRGTGAEAKGYVVVVRR